MSYHRMGHTGREMEDSGAWVKLGKKHYQHISGIEIRYNCNRWRWEIVGRDEAYTLLWPAKYRAERLAFAELPTVGAIQ